ncbi:MAG: CotH kinase family protein, partial [Mycobacterium sp.]|nr:CotH kinase family protein [Mycobacterium sp.]
MLINPARPRLTPGVALAAAGVLALTPAVVAPTELPAPPRVQVTDVALAGIGQDIYYAITPVVQEAVGGVSYLVNAVPLIGGPIAAQININYFQGIQPVIEATVNYLAVARITQEGDDVWANMVIHRDSDRTGEWRIIPFDTNLSWGQL